MLTRSITRKLSTAKAFQKTTILNDLTKKLFILKLNNANSDAATVSYEKDKDVYVLIESFIPETLRGQGLGKILAKVFKLVQLYVNVIQFVPYFVLENLRLYR